MDFKNWCGAVVKQVRFRPDREAIKKELTDHYLDHVRDLQRVGYESELARQRALEAMGDPEEVGRALDRVHKPWLGWLWKISGVIMVFWVTFAAICGLSDWREIRDDLFLPEVIMDYEGEHAHFDPENPYYARVAVTEGGSVEQAGYRFSIPYAALWKWELPGETPYYSLSVRLRVEDGRFWDDGPREALQTLTMTDGAGRSFAASEEYFDCTVEEQRERWDGHVSVGRAERNPFCEDYWVRTVHGWEEPPEWTELVCPSGQGFTLRLEWEVAE